LAYDPVGQGERREHWNPYTQKSDLPGPVTTEHFLIGQALLLLGEDLTNYRIWDGMRAIDYLLTRADVDKEKIGCTGQSGGGTLTQFISALDERIRCAVINEGGTGHRWPVHFGAGSRLGTGDTEQHIFGSGLYGIDLCDLHVAIAPRPLLVTIENYSPRFDRAAEHIRARYELMGVPEKFATEQATDPHGMTVKLRLATTNWFCRWFYNREGPAAEPELQLEEPETLYCTPNGSIRYSHQGQTIFSLMLKKQARLAAQRKSPVPGIQAEIRRLLHIKDSSQPLEPREVVTTPRKGYRIQKLEFLSEPGVYIPTWVYLPDGPRASRTPILFLNDRGIRIDGMEFGVLEKLARKGHLVVAVEVRGIGETAPSQPGDAEETLQYLLWEVGQSLLGMRVQDVMRSVDYVLSRADVDKNGVHAIGKGRGALWLLYAAALDPRIRSAVCDGGLISYSHLASVNRYVQDADVFVLDVLKSFDLPDVAAAVAPRRLTLLSPVDYTGMPAPASMVRGTYAKAKVTIAASDPELDPATQYLSILSEA
jgi:cephalosporin-C deacetylase-like acetyl esterase